MDYALNDKMVAILEIIDKSPGPIGSWALSERLKEKGIYTSSATVGRLLNSLECAGYLEKVTNTGRSITDAGRKKLSSFYFSDHMNNQKQVLESVVMKQDLANFISVLQARRAIERETARLAAKNITDIELNRLQSILDNVAHHSENLEYIAQGDVEFHTGIAYASRNEILASLYSMLFPYGQQTSTFAKIRKKFDYSTTHQDILNALKAHDSVRAENVMVQHIESMIEGLNTYWDHFSTDQKDSELGDTPTLINTLSTPHID